MNGMRIEGMGSPQKQPTQETNERVDSWEIQGTPFME
jgi:hypothetical protein